MTIQTMLLAVEIALLAGTLGVIPLAFKLVQAWLEAQTHAIQEAAEHRQNLTNVQLGNLAGIAEENSAKLEKLTNGFIPDVVKESVTSPEVISALKEGLACDSTETAG